MKHFKVEKFHTDIVSKPTLLKVLKILENETIATPVLLMDGDKIREKIAMIGSRITNAKVFYALKANPDIAVAQVVKDLGLGFEIASEGELEILSSIGVKPDRIITSNPVKPVSFIETASRYGVRYFAFDSRDEIDKMAKYAPGTNVYIRIVVPNEGSEWPLSKKFGVEPDDALPLLSCAKEKGLNPVGITFHVGSQCTNINNWNTAIDKAGVLWDAAEKNGIRLSLLNIGGGYPISYTKSATSIETIERNIDTLIREKFPPDVQIHMEPGRAVIGDAGIMAGRIVGKAKRKDENWLYLDVGVFNGLMESIGGIRYTYLVESRTTEKKQWILAGPSCDSFDVIDKDVLLPEPEIGNMILILSGGAYTVSYASEFNGFRIPKTRII